MADSQINYDILRLKSKNAFSAIIKKLAIDFNLTPIITEAFFQQFCQYFQEHANVSLSSGELSHESVASDEPSSKHIRMARKVTARLKLIDFKSDMEVLASIGLAGVRLH